MKLKYEIAGNSSLFFLDNHGIDPLQLLITDPSANIQKYVLVNIQVFNITDVSSLKIGYQFVSIGDYPGNVGHHKHPQIYL